MLVAKSQILSENGFTKHVELGIEVFITGQILYYWSKQNGIGATFSTIFIICIERLKYQIFITLYTTNILQNVRKLLIQVCIYNSQEFHKKQWKYPTNMLQNINLCKYEIAQTLWKMNIWCGLT